MCIVHLLNLIRMLGTFNQHLLMILYINYWCLSKPTSLHDTVVNRYVL